MVLVAAALLLAVSAMAEPQKGFKADGTKGVYPGGGAEGVDKVMREAGVDIIADPLTVKYAPTAEDLQKCYDLGREIARAVKA